MGVDGSERLEEIPFPVFCSSLETAQGGYTFSIHISSKATELWGRSLHLGVSRPVSWIEEPGRPQSMGLQRVRPTHTLGSLSKLQAERF